MNKKVNEEKNKKHKTFLLLLCDWINKFVNEMVYYVTFLSFPTSPQAKKMIISIKSKKIFTFSTSLFQTPRWIFVSIAFSCRCSLKPISGGYTFACAPDIVIKRINSTLKKSTRCEHRETMFSRGVRNMTVMNFGTKFPWRSPGDSSFNAGIK